MLEQHGADALHDATADLLIDELRIDHGAAILDAPVLQERHRAGADVDVEIGGLHAVGEGERPGARHIVARHHELGLETRRQGIGAKIDDARHLIEAHALAAGIGVDHDAATDVKGVWIGLQDRGRRGEHVRA